MSYLRIANRSLRSSVAIDRMQPPTESLVSDHPLCAPYSWTFARFVAGLRDWAHEQMDGPKVGNPPSDEPDTPKLTSTYNPATWLVSAAVILLVIAVLVVTLVPPLSRALGGNGTSVLSAIAGIGGLVTMAALLALPYLALRKVHRFAHRMAIRGWELETRRRVPIRGVVQFF